MEEILKTKKGGKRERRKEQEDWVKRRGQKGRELRFQPGKFPLGAGESERGDRVEMKKMD